MKEQKEKQKQPTSTIIGTADAPEPAHSNLLWAGLILILLVFLAGAAALLYFGWQNVPGQSGDAEPEGGTAADTDETAVPYQPPPIEERATALEEATEELPNPNNLSIDEREALLNEASRSDQ